MWKSRGPGARKTAPHGPSHPVNIGNRSERALCELGSSDDRWSAGLTGGKQWDQQGVVGVKRKKPDECKQVCRMEGGGDVRRAGGAHPGADAGPMHAGVVMRRMLEFMRHGAAGRRGQ